MSTQGERLKQAIDLAGFKKVSHFALEIDENPVTVRQHINRQSIPKDSVEKYARALARVGVTTDWLLFNKGKPPKGAATLPPRTEPGKQSVAVTHMVGAGDEVYPVKGDAVIGYVPAPPGYESGGAAGVRGDSQLPAFHDKDMLFYKTWELPPFGRRLPARPVLIELGDGRSYLKTMLAGSKLGRYHLISINPAAPPITDVPVVRIARIGWVWVGGMNEVEGAS